MRQRLRCPDTSGHDAPTHHSVSEGGFEPPRPIRPLGPQPKAVSGRQCRPVSSGAVPRTETGDLVGFVESGGIGFVTAWGNSWGNPRAPALVGRALRSTRARGARRCGRRRCDAATRRRRGGGYAGARVRRLDRSSACRPPRVQLRRSAKFETFGERALERVDGVRAGKVCDAVAIVFGGTAPQAGAVRLDRSVQTLHPDVAAGRRSPCRRAGACYSEIRGRAGWVPRRTSPGWRHHRPRGTASRTLAAS
jgi:hypothetical protein